MIAPLVFVVGLSMAKEALEDWRRFIQDMKVNLRKAKVHKKEGMFVPKPWMKLRVGDIVKVEKDQFFPADLLLLSSSYEDGICYVETMNLDGETNLKVKRALETTLPLGDDSTFKEFHAAIRCEDPNPNLYTFVGKLEYGSLVYPLDPSQILLRDSKLRNTAYIYGVVIFTGHDTKVMQNATKSPSKRSRIEKQMDKIIYILFSLLVFISFISSVGFIVKTKYDLPKWWYLQVPDNEGLFNPRNPLRSGFYHLITALMLYGYLIPISLYVSIEVVKVLQALFINQDIHMYDEETGTRASARTSNLNEELGQVDTILSDKTGTLTCNQMDFLKCSIAGIAYGTRASDVELAAAKQMVMEEGENDRNEHGFEESEIQLEKVVTLKDGEDPKPSMKGFSFEDSRLMNGNWFKEPNENLILLFFRILSLCHTAVPEQNEETGVFTYEAESPDEGAFLVAAREFGFEFCRRTQSSVSVRERYPSFQEPVEREFKVLNLLDFTSKRKRMSVIIRDEKGQILLFCKGADSIIFDRLAKNGRMYEEATRKHLNEYGEAGLRTLALAYKKLDEAEYSAWNEEFIRAKTTLGSDRDANLERISDKMERELILVGATAVEDKLQKGVPQCIDKLAQAGLKIWVLTGDKMETAINIGFACSLLRQGMKQICVTTNADTPIQQKAAKEDVLQQITNATQMTILEKDPHAAFALIIDGKTLAYALEDDMKHHFLDLAVHCASVICCRVSPKQKALVTRLVKEGTGKITLAIGDGANDVGMIQEADIGVGISGCEGMQAVMASDFAIAQFRFLERLLVVHGHWCYKRIAQMICYFFYKNIAFGLTIFYFEAFAGFSGQSVYDDCGRFKHLKSLSLTRVCIHNDTLDRFILPGCPLVERVELISCFAPTTIRLNHGCLEHFHFEEALAMTRHLNNPALEIIFEDTVPTLESIEIKGLNNARCINYPTCFPFLRSLCLDNIFLPMESFEISSADFPCLEQLSIKSCTGFDTFRLVNCLVRHLTIWVSRKQVLREIKIDAPVLEEFVYRPYDAGPISFSGETSTKMWKSSINYLMFNMDRLAHSSQWFIDLRKLLEELSRSEIWMRLPVYQLNPFEPVNFENHHSHHNNNPVVEFDYLELCFSGDSHSSLIAFLNCMLCYCRPRNICTIFYGGTEDIVGFVC
ncbi:Putative phospholipid-transporting ATPase 7 [Striga hermonthica]|uniref:Phospholipid-transporting ATPase n=1 Tax=Striga hermonthica TaxID=68872 RepID=A0A9N7N2W7_STRHE|nr:Putative phospholipid-transporting ATPase 7 [Striga hermonthica]